MLVTHKKATSDSMYGKALDFKFSDATSTKVSGQ
uniref:Uncharacterized protein n=1 Tax=Rhizophora mucronata TaxID=61149 RepID=A0A2P2NJB8_RHIMU